MFRQMDSMTEQSVSLIKTDRKKEKQRRGERKGGKERDTISPVSWEPGTFLSAMRGHVLRGERKAPFVGTSEKGKAEFQAAEKIFVS